MELTEEKVTELITSALGAFKTELLSEVDRKNSGVAASLTKDLKAIKDKLEVKPDGTANRYAESKEGEESNDAESQGRLTTKALQSQLEALKSELADKEAKAFQAQRRSAIASVVANHKLNQSQIVQKLFADTYGEKIKNEGDRWFVEDGDKVTELDELFKQYLSTDEGKYFIPATGLNGAGSKESKTHVAAAGMGDPMMEAFSQLATLPNAN